MQQVHKICILMAALIFCFSGLVMAEVIKGDSKTFDLGANPIDMTTSSDGKYTFILAQGGKVFIFDNTAGQVKDTLSVNESVVSIGTSPNGDYLLLADSKNKTLEMLKIAFVVDIDVSSLPFKGPANAPVVVAVFSDYQ